MNAPSTDLPVHDSGAAAATPVETAPPVDRQTLLNLLNALTSSFIQDGIDDFLDRILAWGAEPLTPEETRVLVPRLEACLWSLLTEALRRSDGRPNEDLKKMVGAATRLDRESATAGFVATDGYARRLASLVGDFLDLVSDDEDEPLPDFGSAPAESRWPT